MKLSMVLVATLMSLSINAFAKNVSDEESHFQISAAEIAEGTQALKALKGAYGNCALANENIQNLGGDLAYLEKVTLTYACKGETDGSVLLIVKFDKTSWNETSNIVIEVTNIQGLSN